MEDFPEKSDKYFYDNVEVPVHDGKTIDVTYTNDPVQVQRVIDKFQRLMAEEDAEKVFGVDFEYTHKLPEPQKKIVVVQLAYGRHVLVFHYSSSDWWQSPALADLFQANGVKLASIDTSNDKKYFANTWEYSIRAKNYEDVQDLYFHVHKVNKTGMAKMAAELIHPWYAKMKSNFHCTEHKHWDDDVLPRKHVTYAAIDAFVALELYRVLKPKSEALKRKSISESSRVKKRVRRA